MRKGRRLIVPLVLPPFTAASPRAGGGHTPACLEGGRLDMRAVLEGFRRTYVEVYGPLEEGGRFAEKDGRELFLMYLKPIINGTGNYYVEVQTRDQTRTDVVVDYLGERFVVELKVWRVPRYNEAGGRQVAGYLEHFGLSVGYMLSFNYPFHLTSEVCARMRELGCVKYQVSLDGLRETHDAFRKPGSFDATLEAIPVIQGAGMWANVMTTVSSRNMSEVPELIDLVADLGVDVYAFGRYCPTSGQRAEEFHMEPLAYRALLVECQERIRRQQKRGTRTYFYPKDHLWKLIEWEQGTFVIPEGSDPHVAHDGCHCGSGHLTVLPTGAVHACRRMESPVGDVSRETLTEIYFGDRLAEYRHIDRFEKCAECPLHSWCRGCPAVAFGYSGDHLAPDPQCWYDPHARRY